MATYSDVTTSVTKVTSSGTGVQYTVSAGSRAKVYVQSLSLITGGGSTDIVTFGSSTLTEGPSDFNYPDNVSNTTSYATHFLSTPILLFAGDTVTTAGTATVVFVVEEYSNP